MKKSVANILRGMGGILDIFPSSDYTQFISKDTDAEIMFAAWYQVGCDITQATDKFSHDKPQKKEIQQKSCPA